MRSAFFLAQRFNPRLPQTCPAPDLIGSPGYRRSSKNKDRDRVTVPLTPGYSAESVQFDGVTTALKVNDNLHAPLLCVSDVFRIESGDLSLPGKATPAVK